MVPKIHTLFDRRSRADCSCAARDPCSDESLDLARLGKGGGHGGAGTSGADGGGGAAGCIGGVDNNNGGGWGAGGADDVLWWPGGPCGETLTLLIVDMLPGLLRTMQISLVRDCVGINLQNLTNIYLEIVVTFFFLVKRPYPLSSLFYKTNKFIRIE